MAKTSEIIFPSLDSEQQAQVSDTRSDRIAPPTFSSLRMDEQTTNFDGASLRKHALESQRLEVEATYNFHTDEVSVDNVILRNSISTETQEDVDIRDIAKHLVDSRAAAATSPRLLFSEAEAIEKRSFLRTVLRSIACIASSGIEVS